MGNVATKESDESYSLHNVDSDDDYNEFPSHETVDTSLESGNFIARSSMSTNSKHRRESNNDDNDDEAFDDSEEETVDDEQLVANLMLKHDERLLGQGSASVTTSYVAGDDDAPQYVQPTGDESDDEFEYTALEYFQTYEPKVYIVRRHKHPTSMFVVAQHETPLVRYCKHLALYESEVTRLISSSNPATLATDATDEQVKNHIPGILARIQREVLHEPVHFAVPMNDGTMSHYRENSGDPLQQSRDLPRLPSKVSPIQILDPADVNFEKKLLAVESAAALGSDHNVFEEIDKEFKADHLKQFTQVGTRLKFGERVSAGFSDTSPVEDENDVWLVVSIHYYYAWLAFEKTCEGNGNFLMSLNTRLSTLGESTYFFPQNIDGAEKTNYSAQQEHAVLYRALRAYKKTLNSEAEIEMLHAQIKNLAEAICSKLTDENMKLLNASINANVGARHSDAIKEISDAAALIKMLEQRLKELDNSRAMRSFNLK